MSGTFLGSMGSWVLFCSPFGSGMEWLLDLVVGMYGVDKRNSDKEVQRTDYTRCCTLFIDLIRRARSRINIEVGDDPLYRAPRGPELRIDTCKADTKPRHQYRQTWWLS